MTKARPCLYRFKIWLASLSQDGDPQQKLFELLDQADDESEVAALRAEVERMQEQRASPEDEQREQCKKYLDQREREKGKSERQGKLKEKLSRRPFFLHYGQKPGLYAYCIGDSNFDRQFNKSPFWPGHFSHADPNFRKNMAAKKLPCLSISGMNSYELVREMGELVAKDEAKKVGFPSWNLILLPC